MSDNVLDLDAAKRERNHPDIVVRFGGNDLTVPGELPADVFDPFLSDEFDLVAIIKVVLDDDSDDSNDAWVAKINRLLDANPKIATQVLAALKDAYSLLLGADNYKLFVSSKPSLQDYVALTVGLLRMYGTSLGEAFASPDSSGDAGQTPSPTSSGSTNSTPEASGVAPESSTAS